MIYLCPKIYVTRNVPVKSVYNVALVSADKNSMNTYSLLSSGLGVMSSFSSSVFFLRRFYILLILV